MKQGPSTTTPTKDEAAWIKATKRNGCICCQLMGYPHDRDGSVVEAHHLLSGGIRRGHLFTIGLCMYHHRARLIVNGWTHATHRRLLGPSLAEGSVRFRETFGTDDELLEHQIDLNELHGLKVAHPLRLARIEAAKAANDSAGEAQAA